MRPRLISRGNSSCRNRAAIVRTRASMRPRLISRGNSGFVHVSTARTIPLRFNEAPADQPGKLCSTAQAAALLRSAASMRPGLISPGNRRSGPSKDASLSKACFNEAPADQPGKSCLQRVRWAANARRMASMRPRLISREIIGARCRNRIGYPASMRPRLISRGNDRSSTVLFMKRRSRASMRPRLISRGNPSVRFPVAADYVLQ